MERAAKPMAKLAPPRGVLRWLLKMPVVLYHAHLGWLLGHRFLMITHRGRTSGRIYHTVVEVVGFDRRTRESVVASGWGEKADWLKNIRASSALEIRTGAMRYVPEQRFLEPVERVERLREYEGEHPIAWRELVRILGYPYDGTEASRQALAENLPMVAFRPR